MGQNVTKPVTTVRNLRVLIDAESSIRDHVSRLAQTCFFHLRRLRSVRRQLGQDVTERLVCALVLSRLDYCNVVLAGLPASTLAPLQRVLPVAARVVLDLKPRDHISSALQELHWLPIGERVVFKLCFVVHEASLGQSPDYITVLLQPVAATSSRCYSRQSRRLCRGTDEPENADRAFSTAAPRAWNQLPTELKRSKSTVAFRRGLKTFLFNRTYCSE